MKENKVEIDLKNNETTDNELLEGDKMERKKKKKKYSVVKSHTRKIGKKRVKVRAYLITCSRSATRRWCHCLIRSRPTTCRRISR